MSCGAECLLLMAASLFGLRASAHDVLALPESTVPRFRFERRSPSKNRARIFGLVSS
jgi:hypothetical protein